MVFVLVSQHGAISRRFCVRLRRFKSKSPAQLEEYDRRNVGDGRMGFRVQQLIIRRATVFAVLPKGIVSLPLSSCHTITSCSACVSSPDPMCQWCTAVGKCTTANLCPSATASVCPLQNGPPSPTSLSVDDIRNITLPVKHLPQPDGFSYVCVFGSGSSPASWTVDGVSCGLPVLRSSAADLPPSITDSLALSTSISSYRIVEHNFTVYNCGAFMTCSSCSSSETGCDWCISSHKCVSSGKCAVDKATECVHINRSAEIMIPKGSSHEISFAVAHLDRLPKESNYRCRVTVNGTVTESKARLSEVSYVQYRS
ncbi:unnamed protein product [Nippostrongylus brasiliensis]|uniref:PSI domain-containing protein n=1 Tax=Nippostrongylus brasiliensis TaxID=27835 RepID=A0A0N4YPD3_NIPBR|nr:unnamed protein product [Nippostrongylus brasiliensis]